MDASRLTRRHLLGSAAFATAAAGAATWLGALRSARAEEEGARRSALATGAPVPLRHAEIPGFLSREQLGLHHGQHYGGALAALGGIEARLYGDTGETDKATRRELGRAQSEKANSVLLHELYFAGVTPGAQPPPTDLAGALTRRFGSLDRWRSDLEACALAANGWAMLARHPVNDRLYHVVSDAHDVGPLWLARPILLIDMYEHAFYVDYRTRRAAYVAAWFEHLDWAEAERRWRA